MKARRRPVETPAERPGAITPELFRETISAFATGVTVITTREGEVDLGATASAVTSLSDAPPAVLVCLKRDSNTAQAIIRSGRFAVNILAHGQHELARRFAGKDSGKFDAVAVHRGLTGCPLLDGSVADLECEVREIVEGGTHWIFIGNVIAAEPREGAPLAYLRSRFGRIHHDAS